MRLYFVDTHAARPLYIISILRLNGRTSRFFRFAQDFCFARHSSSKLGSALAYRKKSLLKLFYRFDYVVDCFVHAVWIFATGCCHEGLSATATLDEFGCFADEFASIETCIDHRLA